MASAMILKAEENLNGSSIYEDDEIRNLAKIYNDLQNKTKSTAGTKRKADAYPSRAEQLQQDPNVMPGTQAIS